MTLAWALTDYRAQGQTIPIVLVDIAKLPTGSVNAFNIYSLYQEVKEDTQFDFC
jgi:hypothetical protein